MTTGADHMLKVHDWNEKVFAFVKNVLAYTAVVFLIVPFIAFMVGAWLADYDSSDHELSLSESDAIQRLGLCFAVLFY